MRKMLIKKQFKKYTEKEIYGHTMNESEIVGLKKKFRDRKNISLRKRGRGG